MVLNNIIPMTITINHVKLGVVYICNRFVNRKNKYSYSLHCSMCYKEEWYSYKLKFV